MIRLSVLASALLVFVGSCGETTNTSPTQLKLDRPVDITFTCMGGLRIIPDDRADQNQPDPSDPITFSAMPTTACDFRSQDHAAGTPVPVPATQADLTDVGGSPVPPAFWYGFILQSGPGTVAIAQFPTQPSQAFVANAQVGILDADPLTPNTNSISIGEDPIAIATDKSGCKVVTANAGSCDLSVLDVTTAVDFDPNTAIDVRRVEVTNGNGEPIRARPSAMRAEPQVGESDPNTGLGIEGVIGKQCKAEPQGLLYIAYPNCHVVAAVDAATGRMVDGIRFDAAGVAEQIPAADIATFQCVDECAGGTAPPPGVRPVTLDLEKEPRTRRRRLAIGADNSNLITIVDLDPTTTLPTTITQIPLENTTGDLGVTQVSLSPQIGMGGEMGINDDAAVGGQFLFAYAVASDDTIRVADVINVQRECDTQIDPRYTRDINSVAQLSCLPAGDPTLPRRPGARGPGIQLPGDAFPLSVDFVKQPVDNPVQGPATLVGYFAIVGASNGGVFIVNVDDDRQRDLFNTTKPLLAQMPLVTPHQLRDAVPDRPALNSATINDVEQTVCSEGSSQAEGTDSATGNIVGAPRAVATPLRAGPLGVVSPDRLLRLPTFRQVLCNGVDEQRVVSEMAFQAPDRIRADVFPDLAALPPDETWTVTWEGSLSQDRPDTAVDGPAVREGEVRIDSSGMKIVDQSRPFCAAGVEKFDIVQMRGCDPSAGNVECPTGYTCFVHPNSQVQGLGTCMLADEADRLAEACKDYLTSIRRYTVGATNSGQITLLPRRLTLRTTPVEGCTDDAQCAALANYALENLSTKQPIDDQTAPDTHVWGCQADPLRPPVTTGKRCAMRCNQSSDCTVGTVCEGGTPGASDFAGFCMEGVLAPQACLNAPQRYELRAGDAFAVVGTRSGFVHPIIADANGKCVKDPAAAPQLIGRIPLSAPACDPTADPVSGRKPDGTFEPNPCSLTIETTELQPNYLPGTCTLASNPQAVIGTRTASAIRYRSRGMNLTLVDPTYPGDQSCILDRLGNGLGNIPLVFSGFNLSFRVIAGYSPVAIPVTASLPVRVVRGPTDSIWVVDQGDFLSTSITLPSTRGKVFRIEPIAITVPATLE